MSSAKNLFLMNQCIERARILLGGIMARASLTLSATDETPSNYLALLPADVYVVLCPYIAVDTTLRITRLAHLTAIFTGSAFGFVRCSSGWQLAFAHADQWLYSTLYASNEFYASRYRMATGTIDWSRACRQVALDRRATQPFALSGMIDHVNNSMLNWACRWRLDRLLPALYAEAIAHIEEFTVEALARLQEFTAIEAGSSSRSVKQTAEELISNYKQGVCSYLRCCFNHHFLGTAAHPSPPTLLRALINLVRALGLEKYFGGELRLNCVTGYILPYVVFTTLEEEMGSPVRPRLTVAGATVTLNSAQIDYYKFDRLRSAAASDHWPNWEHEIARQNLDENYILTFLAVHADFLLSHNLIVVLAHYHQRGLVAGEWQTAFADGWRGSMLTYIETHNITYTLVQRCGARNRCACLADSASVEAASMLYWHTTATVTTSRGASTTNYISRKLPINEVRALNWPPFTTITILDNGVHCITHSNAQ